MAWLAPTITHAWAMHMPVGSTLCHRTPLFVQAGSISGQTGGSTAVGLHAACTACQQPEQMLRNLLSNPSVPMSIVLRAARDIPLPLLQSEMKNVLQRRLARIGVPGPTPGLQQLLDCFSERALPEGLRRGASHVRAGAAMVFTRTAAGALLCAALPAPHSLLLHVPPSHEAHFTPTDTVPPSPSPHKRTHRLQWPTWGSASTGSSRALLGASSLPAQHGASSCSSVINCSGRHSSGSTSPWLPHVEAAAAAGVLPACTGLLHATAATCVPMVGAPLQDPPLTAALLDLYLGEEPVSRKAKVSNHCTV
jgi:hypothetical protein